MSLVAGHAFVQPSETSPTVSSSGHVYIAAGATRSTFGGSVSIVGGEFAGAKPAAGRGRAGDVSLSGGDSTYTQSADPTGQPNEDLDSVWSIEMAAGAPFPFPDASALSIAAGVPIAAGAKNVDGGHLILRAGHASGGDYAPDQANTGQPGSVSISSGSAFRLGSSFTGGGDVIIRVAVGNLATANAVPHSSFKVRSADILRQHGTLCIALQCAYDHFPPSPSPFYHLIGWLVRRSIAWAQRGNSFQTKQIRDDEHNTHGLHLHAELQRSKHSGPLRAWRYRAKVWQHPSDSRLSHRFGRCWRSRDHRR